MENEEITTQNARLTVQVELAVEKTFNLTAASAIKRTE
jgi:hypothetical protein